MAHGHDPSERFNPFGEKAVHRMFEGTRKYLPYHLDEPGAVREIVSTLWAIHDIYESDAPRYLAVFAVFLGKHLELMREKAAASAPEDVDFVLKQYQTEILGKLHDYHWLLNIYNRQEGRLSDEVQSLSHIWEQVEEITSKPHMGQPPAGYEPKLAIKFRLEKENVEWLKSKGDKYQKRLDALLTVLRENEQSGSNDSTAESVPE